MDKKTQKQLIDNLLTTHQILESDATRKSLDDSINLSAAKGVIARLILIISNTESKEE